jgi:tetratricopeptide (TPR) repeat protein
VVKLKELMMNIICRFIFVLIALMPVELNAKVEKATMPTWLDLEINALGSKLSIEETEKLYLAALSEAKQSKQLDGYPVMSVLTSRAFFRLNSNDLSGAESDYLSALDLAEKSLNYIWTERLAEKDRIGYLPAYSDPSEERQGKYHDIANIHNWLAEVNFRKGKSKVAQDHLDAVFDLITNKLQPNGATVIEISCYRLQARILEKRGKFKEAQIWRDKADRIDDLLDR